MFRHTLWVNQKGVVLLNLSLSNASRKYKFRALDQQWRPSGTLLLNFYDPQGCSKAECSIPTELKDLNFQKTFRDFVTVRKLIIE